MLYRIGRVALPCRVGVRYLESMSSLHVGEPPLL